MESVNVTVSGPALSASIEVMILLMYSCNVFISISTHKKLTEVAYFCKQTV